MCNPRDNRPGGPVRELATETHDEAEGQTTALQLGLVVPAALKQKLDEYAGFVHDELGGEVETRDITLEIPAHFVETDRGLERRPRRGQRRAKKDEVLAVHNAAPSTVTRPLVGGEHGSRQHLGAGWVGVMGQDKANTARYCTARIFSANPFGSSQGQRTVRTLSHCKTKQPHFRGVSNSREVFRRVWLGGGTAIVLLAAGVFLSRSLNAPCISAP